MIKCEIKGDNFIAEFNGDGDQVYKELIVLINKFAKYYMHTSLDNFIDALHLRTRQITTEQQAEAEARAAQLNKEEAEK